jgi:hypothetical protein
MWSNSQHVEKGVIVGAIGFRARLVYFNRRSDFTGLRTVLGGANRKRCQLYLDICGSWGLLVPVARMCLCSLVRRFNRSGQKINQTTANHMNGSMLEEDGWRVRR